MHYQMTIPQSFPPMTVKELLEDYLLIPRKIRHFLRTKKHLLVNSQHINWQSLVQPGDLLDFHFDHEDYPEKTILPGQASLVDCLYEDDHLIIVNKPEGMKTHANAPDEIALLNHVSAYVGQTSYIVHRLDMETSGAVLFAKNPFILPILNRLLEDRQIKRQYLALCQGKFKERQLTITDKIGRDRHDRRKRIVDNRKGQVAETRVQVLETFQKTSLVSCRLKTGRTHQIRVHLSYQGHALIGDPLYSKIPAPRLMLHAKQLELRHPLTWESISVTAESKSLQQVLNQMKG